jgi:hypothetical protein
VLVRQLAQSTATTATSATHVTDSLKSILDPTAADTVGKYVFVLKSEHPCAYGALLDGNWENDLLTVSALPTISSAVEGIDMPHRHPQVDNWLKRSIIGLH